MRKEWSAGNSGPLTLVFEKRSLKQQDTSLDMDSVSHYPAIKQALNVSLIIISP